MLHFLHPFRSVRSFIFKSVRKRAPTSIIRIEPVCEGHSRRFNHTFDLLIHFSTCYSPRNRIIKDRERKCGCVREKARERERERERRKSNDPRGDIDENSIPRTV